jgi:hypothetical protein
LLGGKDRDCNCNEQKFHSNNGAKADISAESGQEAKSEWKRLPTEAAPFHRRSSHGRRAERLFPIERLSLSRPSAPAQTYHRMVGSKR